MTTPSVSSRPAYDRMTSECSIEAGRQARSPFNLGIPVGAAIGAIGFLINPGVGLLALLSGGVAGGLIGGLKGGEDQSARCTAATLEALREKDGFEAAVR